MRALCLVKRNAFGFFFWYTVCVTSFECSFLAFAPLALALVLAVSLLFLLVSCLVSFLSLLVTFLLGVVTLFVSFCVSFVSLLSLLVTSTILLGELCRRCSWTASTQTARGAVWRSRRPTKRAPLNRVGIGPRRSLVLRLGDQLKRKHYCYFST